MAKVQEAVPDATFHALNIANWEVDMAIDKSTIIGEDDLQEDMDLIVIRLGENVPDSYVIYLEDSLVGLYDYVHEIAPSAQIIITGQYWYKPEKETACMNAASRTGATFVKLDQYGVAAYEEKVGNYVYGDDGLLHMINHPGVASHPSDLGMQAIANELLKAVQPPTAPEGE
jgi:hypothetical protein